MSKWRAFNCRQFIHRPMASQKHGQLSSRCGERKSLDAYRRVSSPKNSQIFLFVYKIRFLPAYSIKFLKFTPKSWKLIVPAMMRLFETFRACCPLEHTKPNPPGKRANTRCLFVQGALVFTFFLNASNGRQYFKTFLFKEHNEEKVASSLTSPSRRQFF